MHSPAPSLPIRARLLDDLLHEATRLAATLSTAAGPEAMTCIVDRLEGIAVEAADLEVPTAAGCHRKATLLRMRLIDMLDQDHPADLVTLALGASLVLDLGTLVG